MMQTPIRHSLRPTTALKASIFHELWHSGLERSRSFWRFEFFRENAGFLGPNLHKLALRRHGAFGGLSGRFSFRSGHSSQTRFQYFVKWCSSHAHFSKNWVVLKCTRRHTRAHAGTRHAHADTRHAHAGTRHFWDYFGPFWTILDHF